MDGPGRKCQDYLVYLLARLGVALVQTLPLDLAYAIAGVVGDVLYLLVGKHRRRALGHLGRSFPRWSEPQCRQVVRASARNLVNLALEVLVSQRLIRVESRMSRFRLTNMAETIRMQVQGGALILATGHFGNWEAAGYMTATIGLPTVTIARRIKNPYMDRYVQQVRQRTGQRMVEKTGAARDVDLALRGGGAVSVVFDQDAGRKGLFVDFFGRKASTYKSIGLMAMAYQAPISVVYCRRLDRSYHFEIAAQRVIRPQEWADKDDPLRWITQEYTAALEQVIRTDPGQYFWVHRRWKHRPPGEPATSDGIS